MGSWWFSIEQHCKVAEYDNIIIHNDLIPNAYLKQNQNVYIFASAAVGLPYTSIFFSLDEEAHK